MNNNTEMKSVGEMCEEIKSLRAENAKLKEEIDGDTFLGINQGLKKEKSDLILQQKRMVKEIVKLKKDVVEFTIAIAVETRGVMPNRDIIFPWKKLMKD